MYNLLPYLTEISLIIITVVACGLIIRWHTDPKSSFDLRDLLVGEDGKASLFRIGQAAALIVSTWAFIILVQKDKLTEYYFYGYMGIWSGINLAKNIFGKATDGSTSQT